MSNLNQVPGVPQEINQETPGVCIFSEDISSTMYHAKRSESIISQAEGKIYKRVLKIYLNN